jgi:DNA repair exonuclease SbcCD ATPase subunit
VTDITDKNLKTDVALIKKDIKQIERFFDKFDTALEAMTEIAQKVAVQGEILKNTADKLEDLEARANEIKEEDIKRAEVIHRRLEDHRKSSKEDHQLLANETKLDRKQRNDEIMLQLGKMNGALEVRLTRIDDRIKILEQWRWYIMGIGVAVLLVAAEINWTALVGS